MEPAPETCPHGLVTPTDNVRSRGFTSGRPVAGSIRTARSPSDSIRRFWVFSRQPRLVDQRPEPFRGFFAGGAVALLFLTRAMSISSSIGFSRYPSAPPANI